MSSMCPRKLSYSLNVLTIWFETSACVSLPVHWSRAAVYLGTFKPGCQQAKEPLCKRHCLWPLEGYSYTCGRWETSVCLTQESLTDTFPILLNAMQMTYRFLSYLQCVLFRLMSHHRNSWQWLHQWQLHWWLQKAECLYCHTGTPARDTEWFLEDGVGAKDLYHCDDDPSRRKVKGSCLPLCVCVCDYTVCFLPFCIFVSLLLSFGREFDPINHLQNTPNLTHSTRNPKE